MTESKFINKGSEYMGTMKENICSMCKYFISGKECEAFNKIPNEIWEQDFLHTVKYPDQKNNIIFKHK